MTPAFRFSVVLACLCLYLGVAQAAQVPLTVAPNPVQFGTVSQYTTSFPIFVSVSNTSAKTVDVTAMAFSGTYGSNFAFYEGYECIGSLPSGATCDMELTFTPSIIGDVSASLQISFTGAAGSPLSVPLVGIGGNPIATLTSLSPGSVYVGGAGFTLTLTGVNFVPTATAYWNNIAVPTSYKSSTQLTAQIPASDITQTSTDYVYAANPAPGGGGSDSLQLQVVGLDPALGQVMPNSVVAGTGATSVTVGGQNFVPGSAVLLGNKSLPTTYVSASQLQAQISASELLTPRIAQLAVSNPPPGGVSQPMIFDVSYPSTVRILNIPANDLVWDPYAQKIYASLPSSFGTNGNSIAVINPKNGGVSAYHFAGSEPTRLALSADGAYLYVGLNGNGSVQRLILPSFAPDIDISLGTGNNGVNVAGDLKVSPGDSHTIALVQGSVDCCANGPLEFFTDTTKLANTVSGGQIYTIRFADASDLYGYNGNSTLTKVAVTATGGTQAKQWSGFVDGSGDIQIDSGVIYSSGGDAFNPATGDLLGIYDTTSNTCCNNSVDVLPKSSVNSLFAIGSTPFSNGFAITSYNLSKFTPVATANLSQLTNQYGEGVSIAPNAIQWGRSGVAFVVQSGCCGTTVNQLVLVQSNLMQPASSTSNPQPVAGSLSPASATHGSGNFQLTITGSGFVPGASVTWNGNDRTVSYVSGTALIVYVPGSDIATAGNASVVVTNPTPGGGKANPLTFAIN